MAKTFLVGEGAVRLTPNAAGFHVKARKDLAAQKLTTDVNLTPDLTGFRTEARSRLKTVSLKTNVELRPDLTGFTKQAKAQLEARKGLELKVKLVANPDIRSVIEARLEMQRVITSMLRPLSIQIEGNLDEDQFRRELARARALARGSRANVPIGGESNGGGGRSGMRRPVRTTALATAAVVAPIVTNAALGGLTALVGAASQAAGALGLLPAAATAAGAGLAAIAIGVSGVSGAFSAISKETAKAGTTADNTASQMAAAARSQAQADRGLVTAHRGVTRALESLNDARKDAVRRLRDMNDEMKMAPLNEREAALAIKEAEKQLQEAYKSGDSLEIEGAQIDLEKSKLQFDQLKKQNGDLAADTAEANKKGIEGDKSVVAAKDGVVDANNALIDAQDAVTAAAESMATAMKGAAGGVDAVAQAMAKLAPNAQDFVRKMQALGPAWTETRKFIQDRLFEGLGDSVSNLATKQLPTLKTGLAGIAEEINRGLRGSLEVFSKDTSVADFATTLQNSRGMWAGLADAAKPFTQSFIDLSTVGSEFMPRLGTAVNDMATKFASSIAEWRADGTMKEFFENSLDMAKQLGRILGNLGSIIGSVFGAGQEVGGGFLNTIETSTRELRDFLNSAEGQEGLKTFFEGVRDSVQTLAPIIRIVADTFLTALGPALTDLVKGAGPGIVSLFEGLSSAIKEIAPVAPDLGRSLGDVFSALGNAATTLGPTLKVVLKVVSGIIEALAPFAPIILGIAAAMKIWAVAIGIVNFVMNANPFVKIAMLLIALGAAIVYAYKHSETFRNVVDTAFKAIGAIATWLWETVLKPVFNGLVWLFQNVLGPVFMWLWNEVITPVMNGIGNVISWAWDNLIKPVWNLFTDALKLLGQVFTWLWENAIKPAWDALSKAISWGWDNVIKPTFNFLKDGIKSIGDFFSSTVDGIKKVWDKLQEVAAKPINWVINSVINGGIGKAWKSVDDFLGGFLPDWKDVAQIKMADGGTVPMTAGAKRGKDSVHILGMPGEHMWDVQDVVKSGGQGTQYAMRDMIGRGQPFTWMPGAGATAGLPGYKEGGEIKPGAATSSQAAGIAGVPDGNISYGAPGFPDWVYALGGQFGVKASTYPGHQVRNGTNYGIDWSGSIDQMQKFAEALMGPASSGKQPEQVIWMNPQTGQKLGAANGVAVGPGTSQPGYYAADWGGHQDHVHTRFTAAPGAIVGVAGVPGAGGSAEASARRGVTAWAEKAFNTVLDPVKKALDNPAFTPPPNIKAVPREIYNGTVDPAKNKMLDKVSEFTSKDGWKDKIKKIGGALFDTGGVIRPGQTLVQNNTGQNEYLLNPNDTVIVKKMVDVFKQLGSQLLPFSFGTGTGSTPTTSTETTAPVNIASVGGKPVTSGELPVPEQTTVVAPTAADLMGTGSTGKTTGGQIPLVQQADGTWTSSDPEWAKLIKRESGGQLGITQGIQDANSGGNEASGLFQIAKGTWAANGGTRYAPTAGQATAEQQAEIAAAIFNKQGVAPWGGRENEGALRAGLRPVSAPVPSGQPSAAVTGPGAALPVTSTTGSTPGTPGNPLTVAPAGNQWPTTVANPKPDDTTGSIYGQDLQGAAVGKDGSYKPSTGVAKPGDGKGGLAGQMPMPTFTNPAETLPGKFAVSAAKTFGFGAQADKINSKLPAVTDLANGVAKAAPAWMTSIATGNPTAAVAQSAEAVANWGVKTATDFANYAVEQGPGIAESVLSAVGAPLIGTVNTGMSEQQVTHVAEDVNNRQARRAKTARRRY